MSSMQSRPLSCPRWRRARRDMKSTASRKWKSSARQWNQPLLGMRRSTGASTRPTWRSTLGRDWTLRIKLARDSSSSTSALSSQPTTSLPHTRGGRTTRQGNCTLGRDCRISNTAAQRLGRSFTSSFGARSSSFTASMSRSRLAELWRGSLTDRLKSKSCLTMVILCC